MELIYVAAAIMMGWRNGRRDWRGYIGWQTH